MEGATGLKINYWVMIDLQGFQSLVDSVGGITMDVYRRVPIGGGSTQIHGYVEAGKTGISTVTRHYGSLAHAPTHRITTAW